MKTDQARAAAAIRKYLKSKGLKCSVRSASGSMTSSVNAKVQDVPPILFKEIAAYCGKYQYGHFDGMTDMYEYSNTDKDIPQAKFVSLTNDFSDELEQEAWEYIRTISPDAKELSEKFADCQPYDRIFEENLHTVVWRFLNGSLFECLSKKFWAKRAENVEPSSKPLTATTCDNLQRIEVKEGDIFVLQCPNQLSDSELNFIKERLAAIHPGISSKELIILEGGMTLGIININD